MQDLYDSQYCFTFINPIIDPVCVKITLKGLQVSTLYAGTTIAEPSGHRLINFRQT